MKKATLVNVSLVIEASVGRFLGDESMADQKKALDEIKRRINSWPEVGFDQIVSEYEAQCSFCNLKWIEEGSIYNGGCCEQDEKNNPNPES